MIHDLLAAGESMVDAAETCGHDDCVDEWNRISKKAEKEMCLNEACIASYREEANKRREQREKAKEENFLKKNKAEDEEILKSFGLTLDDLKNGKI